MDPEIEKSLDLAYSPWLSERLVQAYTILGYVLMSFSMLWVMDFFNVVYGQVEAQRSKKTDGDEHQPLVGGDCKDGS